jgi:hypothetical protein
MRRATAQASRALCELTGRRLKPGSTQLKGCGRRQDSADVEVAVGPPAELPAGETKYDC